MKTIFVRINPVQPYGFIMQRAISYYFTQLKSEMSYVVPGGGYSWEFLVWGVPPGSSNPDPISDQKMSLSTPVFRLDL